MSACIFCSLPESIRTAETSLFFAIPDKFPVTEGHTLIISKRHCSNIFEFNSAESTELIEILTKTKRLLQTNDPSITGFKLVANCGADAGQTVFHAHLHVIPHKPGRKIQTP